MKHLSQSAKVILLFGVMVGIAGCSSQSFELPPASNAFNQPVAFNNKVDIVMMMDNSSSMLQYQTKFAAQVPAMINSLNQLGMDYHIAVVTSDMRSGGSGGRFIGNPSFISKATSNYSSVLQSRVTVGETGSDLERGIGSVYTALSPSYLGAEGSGFLRDDALLAVIFLTNEDDYTSGAPSVYTDFFDKLKKPFPSGARSWVANFIGVVSLDADCYTTGDYKEVGSRYISLVDYSGGTKESICKTSLAKAVDNVKVRISQILTDFHLARPPIESSIIVKVNGVVIPMDAINGWTYDKAGNFVRFHGTSVPAASDQITVDFNPAEAT